MQQETEDLEQSVAEQEAGLEAALSRTNPPKQSGSGGSARPPRSEPAKRNRGALPVHLPRVEQVIDVGDKTCPCCGGSLHWIGDTTAEMLDYVPFQLPAIFRSIVVPRALSIRRDSPRHMAVLPGGRSLARAR
jgi:hypothetical protein